ncbi:unnamed protein product [Urochloa decumbens]|uniref:F-box domain-containing protein n=1 Tax=Urochloa decumbens TaxID=240449 RepID=A0ABC9F011_9POAL
MVAARKKPCWVAPGDGADHLTALPLELRARIVSSLPFWQVVQLSALSRPWRHIHHHAPVVKVHLNDFIFPATTPSASSPAPSTRSRSLASVSPSAAARWTAPRPRWTPSSSTTLSPPAREAPACGTTPTTSSRSPARDGSASPPPTPAGTRSGSRGRSTCRRRRAASGLVRFCRVGSCPGTVQGLDLVDPGPSLDPGWLYESLSREAPTGENVWSVGAGAEMVAAVVVVAVPRRQPSTSRCHAVTSRRRAVASRPPAPRHSRAFSPRASVAPRRSGNGNRSREVGPELESGQFKSSGTRPGTAQTSGTERALKVFGEYHLAPAIAGPGAAALHKLFLNKVSICEWPPCLPSLRNLTFDDATVDAPFAPAAWCPRIEYLGIFFSTIEHARVDIRLPLLKSLDMDDVDVRPHGDFFEPFGYVTIDTPELEELVLNCTSGRTAEYKSFKLKAPQLRYLGYVNQAAGRVHIDVGRPGSVRAGLICFESNAEIVCPEMKLYRMQMMRMLEGLLPELSPENVTNAARPHMKLEKYFVEGFESGMMIPEEKLACDLRALMSSLKV